MMYLDLSVSQPPDEKNTDVPSSTMYPADERGGRILVLHNLQLWRNLPQAHTRPQYTRCNVELQYTELSIYAP